MKTHYDFSAGVKNPYAKRLKRSVTIRLDESTVNRPGFGGGSQL